MIFSFTVGLGRNPLQLILHMNFLYFTAVCIHFCILNLRWLMLAQMSNLLFQKRNCIVCGKNNKVYYFNFWCFTVLIWWYASWNVLFTIDRQWSVDLGLHWVFKWPKPPLNNTIALKNNVQKRSTVYLVICGIMELTEPFLGIWGWQPLLLEQENELPLLCVVADRRRWAQPRCMAILAVQESPEIPAVEWRQ